MVPILILLGVISWQRMKMRSLRTRFPLWGILILAGIALVYTTPWDNYLVATKVWWYDPDLVSGILFGYVPVEEYIFFILQPILVGLWIGVWAGMLSKNPPTSDESGVKIRLVSTSMVSVLWFFSLILLISGWKPGTYMALELAWALPPVFLQLAFGADLLWARWRLVLGGILPLTLYLSVVDSIAIKLGTWTIDPAQSTGWLIGSILPVEEFIFFLMTNILVTFGLLLIWNPASQFRLRNIVNKYKFLKDPQGLTKSGEIIENL